ncbi:hypothetical protein B0H63DRAFT_96212 [Podospora didyma]|uniref:Heterokaryon incompatibility domain-containing protein n=1 Tax=Podospora didyma TaxID=330526 RepID=A0AAE0NX44_9PEZI|nr:hypothetical protein B0H63DRAFT_96212 [Podospora didyma]
MRLLNAKTFVLAEFAVKPPPYAILSHTWGDKEVIFSDIHELIAPRKVQFCDQTWKKSGTQVSLEALLMSKTGIHPRF